MAPVSSEALDYSKRLPTSAVHAKRASLVIALVHGRKDGKEALRARFNSVERPRGRLEFLYKGVFVLHVLQHLRARRTNTHVLREALAHTLHHKSDSLRRHRRVAADKLL